MEWGFGRHGDRVARADVSPLGDTSVPVRAANVLMHDECGVMHAERGLARAPSVRERVECGPIRVGRVRVIAPVVSARAEAAPVWVEDARMGEKQV
jgi:hypothetical protein